MIKLTDFSIGYGDRMLIEGVSTSIPASCLTALIGRNGAGKSTLLRAIGGLNPRYNGRIEIDGHDLRTLQPRDMARMWHSDALHIPDGRGVCRNLTVRLWPILCLP